jgi:hypothetical protein
MSSILLWKPSVMPLLRVKRQMATFSSDQAAMPTSQVVRRQPRDQLLAEAEDLQVFVDLFFRQWPHRHGPAAFSSDVVDRVARN